jgi:hypothetical protein
MAALYQQIDTLQQTNRPFPRSPHAAGTRAARALGAFNTAAPPPITVGMLRKLAILLLVSTAAVCVAAPSTAEQPKRVDGSLYVMPGGFVVGLDSGETAMMSVALVLTDDRSWLTGAEQDRVRGVVDRAVADLSAGRLVSDGGRAVLAERLHREIRSTGLPVVSVLIPDLAVS